MTAEQRRRPVRSYVLREGRMTDGQRRAFDALWGRYGLQPAPGQKLDPAACFANRGETFLEIGFGNGDALAEMAARHPERNYLGIEVHRPGVGRLLRVLGEGEYHNVRVLRMDAMELLSDHLPDSVLDGVYLFFPDPWPKKKHHKRRLVQAPFVDLLERRLKLGGMVHMATDWEDYARQMMRVMGASKAFRNIVGEGEFVPRPESRPLTRFERRGQERGHRVWDLVFRRC